MSDHDNYILLSLASQLGAHFTGPTIAFASLFIIHDIKYTMPQRHVCYTTMETPQQLTS